MSDIYKQKKSYQPTNEHDVYQTEIRCRDDIALKRIEITSKFIGIIYALIWAGALVVIAQIIASHISK